MGRRLLLDNQDIVVVGRAHSDAGCAFGVFPSVIRAGSRGWWGSPIAIALVGIRDQPLVTAAGLRPSDSRNIGSNISPWEALCQGGSLIRLLLPLLLLLQLPLLPRRGALLLLLLVDQLQGQQLRRGGLAPKTLQVQPLLQDGQDELQPDAGARIVARDVDHLHLEVAQRSAPLVLQGFDAATHRVEPPAQIQPERLID